MFDRPPELQHECVECFRYDLFNVECHTCKSHSCLYTLACMFCSWIYMYYTCSEFLIKVIRGEGGGSFVFTIMTFPHQRKEGYTVTMISFLILLLDSVIQTGSLNGIKY